MKNKRCKTRVKQKSIMAFFILLSITLSIIPIKVFAIEGREQYAQIELGNATGIDGSQKEIYYNGYSTVTVNDANAVIEQENGRYFLYTKNDSIVFSLNTVDGYEAYSRLNGAQNASIIEENSYTLSNLVIGQHCNLDFEFQEEQQQVESNLEIQMDNNATVSGNVITFYVNGTEVKATVTGEGFNFNGSKLIVDRMKLGTIKLTFDNAFNSNQMSLVILDGNDGNRTISVNDNKEATFQNVGIVNDSVHMEIQAGNPGEPGDPEQQNYNSTATLKVKGGSGSFEDTYYDSQLGREVVRNVLYKDTYMDARFSINGCAVRSLDPQDEVRDNEGNLLYSQLEYNYNSEENDTSVVISFRTLFLQAFKDTIKINNTVYNVANYIDYNDRVDWLNHYFGQEVFFDIEVPKADDDIYNIEINVGNAEDVYIGNFLWTADPNQEYMKDPEGNIIEEDGKPVKGDAYIGHAKLRFISATYKVGNETITTYANEINQGRGEFVEYGVGADNMNPDYEGGSLVVPDGAMVTMKIIPDYGYQVKYMSSNGGEMTAGESISEFTFPVNKGNFHLGAEVVAVEDEVMANTKAVEGGSITIDNKEIDKGSVRLSVSDANPNSEKKAQFEEKAGTYRVSDYLDISLSQVLYKGTADDVWSNEIEDLNKEASISLQLTGKVDPENTVLLHNVHDGDEIETIEIKSFDEDTNTITFNAKSFSGYAIAVKDSATEDSDKNAEEDADSKENKDGTEVASPQTGSYVGIVVVILSISVLGVIVISKVSKKYKDK